MMFFIIAGFTLFAMLAGGISMYLAYVRPRRPLENGHEFVYVEQNGFVRELNADEEFLLGRNFYPGDPQMPYIKLNYTQLNDAGNQAGFIMRHKVPAHIHIRKKDQRAFNMN